MDIGNGWIETGPTVPPSCEPALGDEPGECACCGLDTSNPLWSYDGGQYCSRTSCRIACSEANLTDMAAALQQVLDGVHGAKDAAKALLAKWRLQ